MIVWTWILALLACGGRAAGPPPHPQDGPDADVRIRIDEGAVRFHVVMNLAFVDGIIGVLREDEDFLHEVEQPAIQDALEAFYREHNRVTVDGVVVLPVFRDFGVREPDLALLPLFPRMGRRALTKVRLVLEYPCKTRPGTVSLVWGAYPPDVVLATPEGVPPLTVQASLRADGTNEILHFRRDEPEHVWHRPAGAGRARFLPVPRPAAQRGVRVPALSAALLFLLLAAGVALRLAGRWAAWRRAFLLVAPAVVLAAAICRDLAPVEVGGGVELPTRAEALAIFAPLHANIYRAFDYSSESDIYDALAQSVDGPLRETVYDEVYRSLIQQEQGGAVSKVERVTPVATAVEEVGILAGDRPGFRVDATWRVLGVVHHWGHSHSRTNEYRARYTVALGAAGWRIAANRVLESRRVESVPLEAAGDGK